MKIAVSGSSGLIGSALVSQLQSDGHTVLRLVRRVAVDPATEISFRPAEGVIGAAALQEVDAVINLGGENIASGRWTKSRRERIGRSRVDTTVLLSRTLAQMKGGSRVLVSASATGYYGDCGDRAVDEQHASGDGFLADVCREWEAATAEAAAAGVRVAIVRLGVVLTSDGGALGKMLTPFRLGLGGKIGSGRQFMPWISLVDAVRAINWVLTNESARGPINLVAPTPVTNAAFTRALGKALHRPTFMSVPAPIIAALFGRMGRETLLSSCRVVPDRLVNSGFQFEHSSIEAAFAALLA